MNQVILIGRTTADPTTRYSGSGENAMVISRFTLAVDRKRKNASGEKEADFIGCVCFGSTAEVVEKYVTKGKKLALRGRIQTGSYEKDGKRLYTTDVVAEEIELLEPKPQTAQQPAAAPAAAPQSPAPLPPATSDIPQAAPSSNIGQGFMNIPEGLEDEGLPFG